MRIFSVIKFIMYLLSFFHNPNLVNFILVRHRFMPCSFARERQYYQRDKSKLYSGYTLFLIFLNLS